MSFDQSKKRKRSPKGKKGNENLEVESIPALDLNFAGNTPESLAAALLQSLPDDATAESDSGKKLLRALNLVQSELQLRSKMLAQKSAQRGEVSAVVISDVSIPNVVLAHIFEFLPAYDVRNRAAFVSTPFLYVTRMPQLCRTLDATAGLFHNSTKVQNMTDLLKLLRQPHFAKLKKLVPPDRVRLRAKALEEISKCCPLLEEFNFGFSIWSKMKIDDEKLSSLPRMFPHLKSILLNTDGTTDAGIARLCSAMGERLKSIRIRERYWEKDSAERERMLTDKTLTESLAKNCRNLEHFEYQSKMTRVITDGGIISILKECPKLKHLSLLGPDPVGFDALRHIVLDGECTALRRLFLVEYSGRIPRALLLDAGLCRKIESKVENCKYISEIDLRVFQATTLDIHDY